MMNLMMVGFYPIGRDSSRGIGCLVQCLPFHPKYDLIIAWPLRDCFCFMVDYKYIVL